jgi:hypothetical protein
MTRFELLAYLRQHHACLEALRWIYDTEGNPEQLWHDCPKEDWLIWFAAEVGALTTYRAMDIACRNLAPVVLDAVGMHDHAKRMRDLPVIADRATASAFYANYVTDDSAGVYYASNYAARVAVTARVATLIDIANLIRSLIPWSEVEAKLNEVKP